MQKHHFANYFSLTYCKSGVKNSVYFLIPSSIKNRFIYLFIISSYTELDKKRFFVVVESHSVFCSSEIVYLQVDCLLDITGLWMSTMELRTMNCHQKILWKVGVDISVDRSFRCCQNLVNFMSWHNSSLQSYLAPGKHHVSCQLSESTA